MLVVEAAALLLLVPLRPQRQMRLHQLEQGRRLSDKVMAVSTTLRLLLWARVKVRELLHFERVLTDTAL